MMASLFPCALALAALIATPTHGFGPSVDRPAEDAMSVDPAVLAQLKQQNQSSAGGPHLWFYWINTGGFDAAKCKTNGGCRCGDIDAAARMPADLFKPENILALARYASLTIKLYSSLGMKDEKLKLGRCHEATTYTCSGGGVQGINWVNSALMQPICKYQCGCTYPACKDQPDDPAKGKFCSLCGPKYNAKLTINLWNMPNPDDDDQSSNYGPCGEPVGGTIPDVVAANPDLSILLAAVKAADLVGALAAPGPWTLFAPSNKAFKKLPLLGPFSLASLLKPKNKARLAKLLTYHLVPDSYCAAAHFCSKIIPDGKTPLKTVEGNTAEVAVSYVGPPQDPPLPTFKKVVTINGGAKVVTADVRASDSVVHIIDSVLLPKL